MNSERKNKSIGNTPLLEFSQLIKAAGVAAVWVKDESKNKTGTVKDRRNKFILDEALRLRVDKLVLITSGNNGFSLSTLAEETEVKVVCIVDRNLSQETINSLKQVAYQVIEVNLQHKILRPEEIIAFAREREDEVIWDVTNGYEESYSPIVSEIRDVQPTHIVVPVGSGEIFVGIAQGIERYRMTTKIIGIGVQNTLQSFADKLHTPWTPYARTLEAYQTKGHPIYRIQEEEVKSTYRQYQQLVRCEPSSAVVFSVFQHHQFKKEDRVILLNTGKTKV